MGQCLLERQASSDHALLTAIIRGIKAEEHATFRSVLYATCICCTNELFGKKSAQKIAAHWKQNELGLDWIMSEYLFPCLFLRLIYLHGEEWLIYIYVSSLDMLN